MKTTRKNTSARFTGLAVALALVAGLTGAASAADLIKGGERQLNLLGIKTKAVPNESTYVPMSCPKCNLACCNTKKGSDAATKGMEKKTFEVAPLK